MRSPVPPREEGHSSARGTQIHGLALKRVQPSMAAGLVTVTLNRDGPQTPWGFRLHGGKDIGFPMVIQRVFLGSPSEGELQRGDTILRIQGRDTANMTHMEAYDIIKAAGTRLSLLIRRLPGAPQPPISPTSPVPPGGMHPYAALLRETEAARTPPKMFQPKSPPKFTPKPLPTSQPIKEYCYSPLPTTPLPDLTPLGGYFAPNPKNLADSEIIEYHQEIEKEKEAIVHQGHRTFPLIAPRPKTRHDIPMGSYLRFVHDPNWKGRSTIIQPSVKPAIMNKYPTPTYSTIGFDSRRVAARAPGALAFERPLDEGSQLVHHQYNSPLFLYSQRNVDETIKDQTGVSPTRTKLNVTTPLQPGQAAPLSPGTLAPAKAGTKLSNIVDITLSPTFQMIQEVEKRSSSPQPTPQNIRTPTLPRKTVQSGPRPFGFDHSNPFGSSREVIHQSGSFKSLMSQLSAPPEQQP